MYLCSFWSTKLAVVQMVFAAGQVKGQEIFLKRSFIYLLRVSGLSKIFPHSKLWRNSKWGWAYRIKSWNQSKMSNKRLSWRSLNQIIESVLSNWRRSYKYSKYSLRYENLSLESSHYTRDYQKRESQLRSGQYLQVVKDMEVVCCF